MGVKIVLITAAITTGIQGLILMLFSGLALAQYLCVIDFLRGYPVLTYIKILYFFNPSCSSVINIGQTMDGIPDQAFILISKEPLPTTRLFYINCINLGISVMSIISSAFVIVSTARGSMSNQARWLWAAVNICACVVDVIAAISLFNDTFYITTLEDIKIYLNARIYGVGNADIDFSWGAWLMVILYSRIGILFFINIALLIVVFIWGNLPIVIEDKLPELTLSPLDDTDMEEDLFSRSQIIFDSFLNQPPPALHTFNNPVPSSTERPAWKKQNKKVHFPENLLSLPQRLDNIISGLQQNFEPAIIHIEGESTEPRVLSTTESSNLEPIMPLPNVDGKEDQIIPVLTKERGTATELQGQRPWAYFPAPAFGMRDLLPSDEDLPPLPLPDYNAKRNKTSVHRAPFETFDTFEKREQSLIPKVMNKADVFFY